MPAHPGLEEVPQQLQWYMQPSNAHDRFVCCCDVHVQARDELEHRLSAACKQYSRRLKRRAWTAWQQYWHYKQCKRQSPDADPAQLCIAQQHWRLALQAAKYRIVQGWWLLVHRAAAARRIADTLAVAKQRWLQRQVLQALQRHMHISWYKKQQLQKAAHFHASWQLRYSWAVWSEAAAASRVGAAQQAQHSQQLLNRVLLRWQRLSAAAASADALSTRLQHFEARRELRFLSSVLGQWHCLALQSSKAQKAAELEDAQQQLQALQQRQCQEQQEVIGSALVQQQLASLQQQLDAALASKTGLEQVGSCAITVGCLER